MAPVGPLKFKRAPEGVRRQLEVAAATAWEALIEAHAAHALRFVALMSARMRFDDAIDRYLEEMDVRDPMAASVRSRVLVALEDVETEDGHAERPWNRVFGDGEATGARRLRRFRPDVLVKGMARMHRESEAAEQWVRLAMARAEESVIRAHIDNALVFAGITRGHLELNEAVEDYIELLRVTGGRAQAVYQRTMAHLADLHLPEDDVGDEAVDPSGAGSRPDD